MELVRTVGTEKEVAYFKKYKASLDDFLSSESENLKLSEYMKIVQETKDVQNHIEYLKSEENASNSDN